MKPDEEFIFNVMSGLKAGYIRDFEDDYLFFPHNLKPCRELSLCIEGGFFISIPVYKFEGVVTMVDIKKHLDKIQGMSNEDKKKVIEKLPIKALVLLYSGYCTPEQLTALFIEWDRLAFDVLYKTRNVAKIKGLASRLKIMRKFNLVPDFIKDKYL